MNVLVTGGAGFIGFSVAQDLDDAGHSVTILDKEIEGRNELNWLLAKECGIDRIKMNVCQLNFGLKLPKELDDIDAVVHCAGQTAVTRSLTDPSYDFINNAEGTFAVCEFARKRDAKILYTSTNKVYGDNVNKVAMTELDTRYEHQGGWTCNEMFPIDHTQHTPYGVSKLAADLYVQDYYHTYGLDTIVFRMSCIYGSAQMGSEDQGWIAHIVHQWVHGNRINIFGNGKQVRDVLHVDDLTELMVRVLGRDGFTGVFNVGGGPKNTISVLELFNMLEEWQPYDRNNLFWYPWRPADQKCYISNISKIKRMAGFYPEISPQNGIRQIFNKSVMIRDSVRIR